MSVEVEQLSPLEQQFEHWRVRLGLVLSPVVFGGIMLADLPSLKPEAHRLAAVMAAVVVLWITEAVAMPVAALIGAAFCVALRVAPAKEVFAPFADPIMFLFIGSFMLARAIFLHGLDRRLAFGVLSLGWVGGSPARILFAFGAVTASLSAWISNTATTAMMFAIGMSILSYLLNRDATGRGPVSPRYATGLMLMTSFAASIGGLATPVGTPPNLIGLGKIRESLGVDIPFLKWMFVGVPIVVCLFLYLFVYLNWLCPAGRSEVPGEHVLLEQERRRLGPWTRGQRSTIAAFAITVVLWIVPGI
ncbi:MAG TPA: SLC13 family permease, partial [Pirellulales bacterium]|nr:SLC13 family permease [Pirellulales bacterium]